MKCNIPMKQQRCPHTIACIRACELEVPVLATVGLADGCPARRLAVGPEDNLTIVTPFQSGHVRGELIFIFMARRSASQLRTCVRHGCSRRKIFLASG